MAKQSQSSKIDLRTLASSPLAFRAALLIDTDAGPRPLDSCLDDWQRDDFAALDPAWQRVAGQQVTPEHSRAWLERPRGHSKTSDIAVQVLWAIFSSPRRLSGVAAAASKDQAKLLRDAIEKILRLNSWLAGGSKPIVEIQNYKIRNPRTGSELDIISSDAATSFGHTPDFIIADELCHWGSDELWQSLLSSAAKRSHCLLLVITNAGFVDSWQWKLREAIRESGEWYFNSLDGPRASWISERHLAEQRRLLPAIAFARLWLNQWGSGSGDAIEESQIRAAITLGGPCISPERGYVYLASLDLGITHDASALAILGKHVGYSEPIKPKEPPVTSTQRILRDHGFVDAPPAEVEWRYVEGTGRLKLVAMYIWKAPKGERVSVDAIRKTILEINERFRLSCVAYDTYGMELPAELLGKAGLNMMAVPPTPQNQRGMAMATLETFGESLIDLYPHEWLLTDLRALRVQEMSYGVRLTSTRNNRGHGDAANALAIGLLASRTVEFRRPAVIDGPLICWP